MLNLRDPLLYPLIVPLILYGEKLNLRTFEIALQNFKDETRMKIIEILKVNNINSKVSKDQNFTHVVFQKIYEKKFINHVYDISNIENKIIKDLISRNAINIEFDLFININTKTNKERGQINYEFKFNLI